MKIKRVKQRFKKSFSLNCENKFAILENPDGKNVDSNRA
jgi:hypothetical protein